MTKTHIMRQEIMVWFHLIENEDNGLDFVDAVVTPIFISSYWGRLFEWIRIYLR
jgi:hypothetical protein